MSKIKKRGGRGQDNQQCNDDERRGSASNIPVFRHGMNHLFLVIEHIILLYHEKGVLARGAEKSFFIMTSVIGKKFRLGNLLLDFFCAMGYTLVGKYFR